MFDEFNLYDTDILVIESVIKNIRDIDINPYIEANEEFMLLTNELFSEAQVGGKADLKRSISNTVDSTIETTKTAAKVYDTTTTAGGSMIRATYDLTMAMLNLVTKVANFIIKHVMKLPQLLTKLINGLAKLPSDIKSKINGDISLYITLKDFDVFNKMKRDLANFLHFANQLAAGDSFTKKPLLVKIVSSSSADDVERRKTLERYYNEFKSIKFELTKVPTNDRSAFELYLDPNSDYYKNLKSLSQWFSEQEKPLLEVQKKLQDKFNKADINSTLSDLTTTQQAKFRGTIQMIGELVKVIGDIGQYVIKDIKTINDNVNSVLNRLNKKSQKK